MDIRTIRNEMEQAFELYEKIRKRAQNDGLASFLFQELWRNQRIQAPRQERRVEHKAEALTSQEASAKDNYATAQQIKRLEDLGVRIPYNLGKPSKAG